VSGSKVAVFSWEGCSLKLTGKTEVSYTAKETPMVMYLNVHVALEQMRVKADKENNRGPRVMIVGPTDVGKSTVCKILVNYASRIGRSPVLVDLDVGQNELSIPGAIAAVVIERPADIEEGYCLDAPLAYHFGHKSPSDNIPLYNTLVTRLAEIINMRCESNSKTNLSGFVINTCGWVQGGGYQCLIHAAQTFEVDVVVVLDKERLHNELTRDLPSFVKVVLLPKSGGVVERSQKLRAKTRDLRIHQYFYGVKQNLFPFTFDVKFSQIFLYKIGAPELPNSMLPLGMTPSDNRTKPVRILPSVTLLHHVLSASFASSPEEDIVQSNVAGFIVITDVDSDRQTFKILAPSPAPLPWNILLVMEDILYMDSLTAPV